MSSAPPTLAARLRAYSSRSALYLPALVVIGIILALFLSDTTVDEGSFWQLRERKDVSWAVHRGDLKVEASAQGGPAVSGTDAEAAEWQPIEPGESYPISEDEGFTGYYWLRISLPAVEKQEQALQMRDPQLMVQGYKHIQVFAGDGRGIYDFNMAERDFRVNKFLHWGLAPLGEQDFGGWLYVRIYEPQQDPLLGSFTVGDRGDLYLYMFQRDALRMIFFILFLFLSVSAFVMWAGRTKAPIYFHFAVLCACAAYGAIGRAQVLELLGARPVAVYLQDVALPVGAAALFGFLGQVYSGGMARFFRGAGICMALLTGAVMAGAWRDVRVYRFLVDWVFMTGAVLTMLFVLVMIVGYYRRRKDRETMWILWGCFLMCVFAVLHNIDVNVYPYTKKFFAAFAPMLALYTHETQLIIGVWLFVLCLGAVLVLRYRETERRVLAYAEELEEKNRKLRELDRVKDDFLARTSHELRTPLFGMIGMAECLLDQEPNRGHPESERRLSLLISSGRRLTRLINDILDLSKIKHNDLALRIGRLDVRQSVDIVVSMLEPQARGKGLRLLSDIPAGLPEAAGDEDRIEQVLYNLVGNAVKFTESGEVRVRAAVAGDVLRVEVSDTGVGIPEDEREAIFDPFVQARHSPDGGMAGTGLGLAVCRQLIRLHGGRLDVEPGAAGGSVFWFELPLWVQGGEAVAPRAAVAAVAVAVGLAVARDEAAIRDVPYGLPEPIGALDASGAQEPTKPKGTIPFAQEQADKVDPPSTAHRPVVLVVDDEPVNLEVLGGYLGELYQVAAMQSAVGALAWMESGGKPDLILSDVMMPKMNGYELCRTVRSRFPHGTLPILLLTAKDLPGDVAQGFESGASDYVPKPVAKQELLARVRLHLRLSQWHQALEKEVLLRTSELEETNRQLHYSMQETMQALEEVVALEERNRIAHEIHDTVGHTLTATVVQMEATKRLLDRDKAAAVDKLNTAQNLVRKGLEDIRGIVRMLKDDAIRSDLAESLHQLIQDTRDITGIDIDAYIGPLPASLSALHKKLLYHALQEGLTNGLKHGAGSRFEFTLTVQERMLHFSLKNDGAPYTRSSFGVGLSAMRERTAHLGGTLEVNSPPDWGCELRIRLPVTG